MLTGTPIVNSPGDLAGPLSILTGERITPGEFESRFVGRERAPRGLMGVIRGVPAGYRPVMRDVRGLERLLRGKVDYHAPTAPPVNEQDERIEVDLGRDQANLHNWMWGKLPAITRWKLSRSYPLTSTEVANLSGFMTGPRQAATSTLPFMRGRETSPLRAFQRSTKLQRAVSEFEKELATNSEAKALIFSNFIDAGLSPYAAALEARKIPHGVFKGGLSDKARKQLVADYNEGKLRALLLGPSGSEGLSTRRTTLIQQLDPHWNETRGRQNKGRGIRFDSHADLPPEERNVRVQRFISRMPQGRLARLLGRKPRPTADEVLERMSAEKERLNEQFREVLRRVGSERSEVGGEKEAAAPALVELRRAKAMSDRRDFKGKHQVLRRLMQEQPGAFFVDDPRGHFVGVTHRDLGFRVHLPRNLIPAGVEGLSPAAPKAAAALVMEAATRRKKSPTGPSAAAIDRVPEVPAEPSPDDALALALEGVRARRRRATRPPASRPKVAAGLADATDFAARYFIPALAGTAGVTSQNPLIGAAVGAVGGGLLSLPGILDERSRILASRPGRRPSGADRRAARKSLGARLSLGLLPGAAVGALSGAAGHALIHKDAAADLRRVKSAADGDAVLHDAALGAAALGLAGGGVGWAGSRILGDVEDIARWVARRKPAPPRDHVGAALRMGGIGAVLGGAIGAAAAASPAASAPENAKSLASVVGRYYENAPGKFDGAVDRAVASRKDVPGFGALGFTAEDAKTGIPVEVSPAVTAGADGQTTMGRFVRPRVRVLPQTSIGTKADAKYVLEHELSHAALDGLPMRRGESAVQRGGGPAADGAAYFRSPSELIPRVADVKRKWVAAHPGRDVTTPEEAAEALDWFIKQRPNGARDADTLDGWGMGKSPSWWSAFGGGSEDSPEVEALRARILSLMPQLVRNLVPRDGTKTAAEYADVPAMVAARIKAAEAPTWPDGDVLADPAALADRIAIGALAAAPRIPLLGLEKLAADAQSVSTGLFTPSIPVDAFNRVVWNDVWGANPLGTRPAHGSADARLGTPAPVAAAVSGLVAGAGAARGSDRVSPWDVATAAGAGGAGGWLGGLVLGRTVGALAGLPPEAQSRMQDVGLWGGLLAGAVRGVFGKGR